MALMHYKTKSKTILCTGEKIRGYVLKLTSKSKKIVTCKKCLKKLKLMETKKNLSKLDKEKSFGIT